MLKKFKLKQAKSALSGKTLNLADNMEIKSNNFNVDSKGNMICNNGRFVGGNISLGGSESESAFKVTGNVGNWGAFRTSVYPNAHRIAKNLGSDESPSWQIYIDTRTAIINDVMQGEIQLSSDNSGSSTIRATGIITPSVTQILLERL